MENGLGRVVDFGADTGADLDSGKIGGSGSDTAVALDRAPLRGMAVGPGIVGPGRALARDTAAFVLDKRNYAVMG